MIQLRQDQSEVLGRLRQGFKAGHNRQIMCCFTGWGKTVCFSFMAKAAVEKGMQVMILCHRKEILDQIERTLERVNVTRGSISVISVQSLVNQFDKIKTPDFIIIDECKHSVSSQFVKVFAQYPEAKVLGADATPERLDGRGLGEFYSNMVVGPDVSWLISQGFIARPVYYAPRQTPDLTGVRKVAGDFSKSESAAIVDKPAITGDIVSHYKRLARNRTGVVFCVNLEHAENLAAAFCAGGIAAARIDGKLTDSERKKRVADLASGSLQILTSCELISEGFDLPAVGAAVLARPTASLALHLQQIGRCLRPAPGKTDALILDHVGNCLRHGLAEEPREWSLEGGSSKKRTRENVLETRQCEKCYAVFNGLKCPQCGTERVSKAREIEEREGELERLSLEQMAQAREKRREEGRASTLAELMAIEKARGYKRGWAWHRWNSRKPVGRTIVEPKGEELMMI